MKNVVVAIVIASSTVYGQDFSRQFESIKRDATPDELYRFLYAVPKSRHDVFEELTEGIGVSTRRFLAYFVTQSLYAWRRKGHPDYLRGFVPIPSPVLRLQTLH